MAKLAVGAVSKNAVIAALNAGATEIVASRAQVESDGGYTGMTQRDLVNIVREHDAEDNTNTMITRDHGGPWSRSSDTSFDDCIESLCNDVHAGFDVVHLDMCNILSEAQDTYLYETYDRIINSSKMYDDIKIDIGGEHTNMEQNIYLYEKSQHHGMHVSALVYNFGSHVWADSQIGHLVSLTDMTRQRDSLVSRLYRINEAPVSLKAHNMDFLPRHVLGSYARFVDVVNVAPEVGVRETYITLKNLLPSTRNHLLDFAYDTMKWTRWFNKNEGGYTTRAMCALRYIMHTDDHVRTVLNHELTTEKQFYIHNELTAFIKTLVDCVNDDDVEEDDE